MHAFVGMHVSMYVLYVCVCLYFECTRVCGGRCVCMYVCPCIDMYACEKKDRKKERKSKIMCVFFNAKYGVTMNKT